MKAKLRSPAMRRTIADVFHTVRTVEGRATEPLSRHDAATLERTAAIIRADVGLELSEWDVALCVVAEVGLA